MVLAIEVEENPIWSMDRERPRLTAALVVKARKCAACRYPLSLRPH